MGVKENDLNEWDRLFLDTTNTSEMKEVEKIVINAIQMSFSQYTLARVSELPVTKTVPLALNAQQNI